MPHVLENQPGWASPLLGLIIKDVWRHGHIPAPQLKIRHGWNANAAALASRIWDIFSKARTARKKTCLLSEQKSEPRHHHFESFAADLGVACACFDEFADLCAPRLQESVDPLNLVQDHGFFDRKELVTCCAAKFENLDHKARLFNGTRADEFFLSFTGPEPDANREKIVDDFGLNFLKLGDA
jgi:hypothetical protein